MRILETSDIWDIWLAFLLSWPSASAKGNIYDPPFIGTTNQIPLPPKFQQIQHPETISLIKEG